MWGQIAAVAAPFLVGALQKRPKAPGAPAPVAMPDRSGLVNQLIDSAFNPNSHLMELAAARTSDNVGRALGRRGMLNSTLGMQLRNNALAELGANWLNSASQRQGAAFGEVTNYDRARANLEASQNQAMYNAAMDAYKDRLARNANQVQGVAGLAAAGLGIYNQNQMMDRLDNMVARSPIAMPEVGSQYSYSPGYGLGGNYQLPVADFGGY